MSAPTAMCLINHTQKSSTVTCPTFCRGPWSLCKVVPLVCEVLKPEESPLSPADTAYRSDYMPGSFGCVNRKKWPLMMALCRPTRVTLVPARQSSSSPEPLCTCRDSPMRPVPFSSSSFRWKRRRRISSSVAWRWNDFTEITEMRFNW